MGYRVHGLGSPFLEATVYGVIFLSAAAFIVAGWIWYRSGQENGRWN
jgi:hypothetical protein